MPAINLSRSEEEVDKLRQAIAEYDEALENPRLTGMARVRTAQAKRDTEKILESLNNAEEFKRLEEYFIANAREFSILKGIEYDSWREASVPVRTLNKAGIFAPRHPRDLIEISSSSESDEHEAE